MQSPEPEIVTSSATLVSNLIDTGQRLAQDGGGAGVWADQGIQTAGLVPIARPGAGERGMGADGHNPQPAQVVQGIAGDGLRTALSASGLRFTTSLDASAPASRIGRVQRATGS